MHIVFQTKRIFSAHFQSSCLLLYIKNYVNRLSPFRKLVQLFFWIHGRRIAEANKIAYEKGMRFVRIKYAVQDQSGIYHQGSRIIQPDRRNRALVSELSLYRAWLAVQGFL